MEMRRGGIILIFPHAPFQCYQMEIPISTKLTLTLSGKFAVIKIKSSGSNSRLSVRGFKLKYEMGGV